MTEELQERVERWLRTLGSTPVRMNDERTKWHFETDYPSGTPHRIHVLNPKERPEAVVIVTAVTISAEHVKTFDDLDDDAKTDFLWDIRNTLNREYAEFRILGGEAELSCPQGFEIMATRYEDGLSMDSFARSVSSVYKAELAGIMCVQQHLGPRGYGSSARYDFRRLGL